MKRLKVNIVGLCIGAAAMASAAEKPNVVFILSDDQGYADVGFHEGIARTPHLDRLKEQGMELTRHYVQPQCTPTRVALLSGRYPYREAMHAGVVLPNSKWGLPAKTYTLAEMFKDAGYQTALIGKWHVGHHLESQLPENQGFDYFYGLYMGMVDNYFPPHDYLGGHALHCQRKPVKTEGYMTDLFTEEAIKVIERKTDDKPLFLYLAYNAPHDPLQAKAEDLAKYPKVSYENRKAYLAMIDCMDQGIGKVLAALENKGIRDNTLIIFTSDNGGVFYREQFAHNTPLREGKGGAYEGGVRTPALAVWNGRIEPGSVSGELVYMADWYATLMRLAGGTLPAAAPAIDGLDAWPILRGGKSARTEVPIISHNKHALITKDWIMVQNLLETTDPAILKTLGTHPGSLGAELYRIDQEIWQQTDLSIKYPETLAQMLRRMKVHYAATPMSPFDMKQFDGPYPKDWGAAVVDDLKE